MSSPPSNPLSSDDELRARYHSSMYPAYPVPESKPDPLPSFLADSSRANYLTRHTPQSHSFTNSIGLPMAVFGGFFAAVGTILYMGRNRGGVKFQVRLMESRVLAQGAAVAGVVTSLLLVGSNRSKPQ